MSTRTFALVFSIVALLAGASSAAAQTASKLPRIAYVWLQSEGPSAPYTDAFRERMGQLGWTDGRTFVLEFRDAHGSQTELDSIMQALVQSKVDIIVAMCTPEGLSARKFTTTIPIVMAATGDPVAAGLAESFARPGGNVTGISGMMLELSAKRVGLLKEAFPKIKQVTAFWNPVRPDNRVEVKTMQDAGTRLAINIQSVEVRTHVELASQLDAIGWDGTQAILTTGDTLVTSERYAIVERAAKLRLPAIYEDRIYVEAGGIMSYGPNVRNMHRRAADYVDKILKGAKAGELPFEQPTKFEFIVNNKAAKALAQRTVACTLFRALRAGTRYFGLSPAHDILLTPSPDLEVPGPEVSEFRTKNSVFHAYRGARRTSSSRPLSALLNHYPSGILTPNVSITPVLLQRVPA